MHYHYEALDPESFQKFAQALIVASHPDAQCLPVGQPDGGRDAVEYVIDPDGNGFIVFQVKFTRDPASKSERDAIEGFVQSEKNKVQQLTKRGAKRYYLITNVAGTAHPNTGSVDRVHTELTNELGIPSYVWWRDDLDARVDADSDIKWSYPAILKATDILPWLLKEPDGEKDLDATRAINGYLATQYRADREVKFKQVELKRRLTDLFVDLPLSRKAHREDRVSRHMSGNVYSAQNALADYIAQQEQEEEAEFYREAPVYRTASATHRIRAASFILKMPLGVQIARFVMEGAPGQGKSTVTQYICQVCRLHILKKPEIKDLPKEHESAPVRVPFRVDLRDFAAWVSGRHPFAKADPGALPVDEPRSLESFLAMQVGWHSGGLTISQSELLQFLAHSHCLLVLDGFDEVADIETRRKVVAEICEASDRLESVAMSILIIVTSRPAAFANSPGFPEEEWTHFELKDLKRTDIESYKNKWTLAQALTESEAHLLSETLKEKLEQPHLRDLARNPMQLAILLQLIHVQGPAMPDKRTALYEKYMDLYFNREAEKTPVVRDYRDLLMSRHGYLGWVLQVQSEEGRGSGSIERTDLHRLIRQFLEAEEYDSSLADRLLTGMVERVVALVSRVEGTFEFEVQPIREYFTAKYLYETAAYSPPGRERTGTRAERFEALSKSLYWTNVTRFFCGFYDKGELGSLLIGLLELSEEDEYALVNQPRSLAIMLLSDWVFSQSPRLVRQVIEFVVSEPAFLRLTSVDPYQPRYQELELPERCGQKELADACFEKLTTEDDAVRRRCLREIIAQNSTVEVRKAKLRDAKYDKKDESVLAQAVDFRLVRRLSSDEVREACGGNLDMLVAWFARSGRLEEIISSDALCDVALRGILRGELFLPVRRLTVERDFHCFEFLSYILTPFRFGEILNYSEDASALFVVTQRIGPMHHGLVFGGESKGGLQAAELRGVAFAKRVVSLMNESCEDWQRSLELWGQLVDGGLMEAPNSGLFVMIALISSGVQSKKERGVWSDAAWKPTSGLVERLRFARLKSGQAEWWLEEFERVSGTDEAELCFVTCALWVTENALSVVKERLVYELDKLSENQWSRVTNLFEGVVGAIGARVSVLGSVHVNELSVPGSARLASLLTGRLPDQMVAKRIGHHLFRNYAGRDVQVLRRAIELEFGAGDGAKLDWGYILALSKLFKASGSFVPMGMDYGSKVRVPEEFALEVLRDCDSHVESLVNICEQSYGMVVARNAPRVSDTAINENWFSPQA